MDIIDPKYKLWEKDVSKYQLYVGFEIEYKTKKISMQSHLGNMADKWNETLSGCFRQAFRIIRLNFIWNIIDICL